MLDWDFKIDEELREYLEAPEDQASFLELDDRVEGQEDGTQDQDSSQNVHVLEDSVDLGETLHHY